MKKNLSLPTLAIDFDGVIHDHKNPIEGKRMGAPIQGAKEALEYLGQHFMLVIFTVRGNSPQHIEDWLNYYQIPFNEVTNIKPNAKYYIDDKGIRFTEWTSVLSFINEQGV